MANSASGSRTALARPKPEGPRYVRIRDTEEKGSDVNLATRLLVGGFTGDYEQAVVVSNDSDLAAPIRYVNNDLGLRVVLVNPDSKTSTHNDLVQSATYARRALEEPPPQEPTAVDHRRRAWRDPQAHRLVIGQPRTEVPAVLRLADLPAAA